MVKVNSGTGKTGRPTCCPQVDADAPFSTGGADAAGVNPLVGSPHAPQQQRGVPGDDGIGEDLRPPSEQFVLVLKVRSSVVILENHTGQSLLHPAHRHPAEPSAVLSGQEAAEELILAVVGDGYSVAALHIDWSS